MSPSIQNVQIRQIKTDRKSGLCFLGQEGWSAEQTDMGFICGGDENGLILILVIICLTL